MDDFIVVVNINDDREVLKYKVLGKNCRCFCLIFSQTQVLPVKYYLVKSCAFHLSLYQHNEHLPKKSRKG